MQAGEDTAGRELWELTLAIVEPFCPGLEAMFSQRAAAAAAEQAAAAAAAAAAAEQQEAARQEEAAKVTQAAGAASPAAPGDGVPACQPKPSEGKDGSDGGTAEANSQGGAQDGAPAEAAGGVDGARGPVAKGSKQRSAASEVATATDVAT